MLSLLNEKFKFAGNFFFFFGRIDIARDTFWNHQILVLAYKYLIFSSGVVLFVMGEVIYNYFSKQ